MDLRSLIAKMDAIESKISEAPEVATPPAAAPANPWTNDPVKSAAWEKLSPQMKANIGGANPTDKAIISGMADGSGWGRAKGINDANPDGTPKAAAQAANPAPTSGAATTQAQADANRAKVQAALPANMSMNDFDAARNASEPDPRLPAGMTQADVDQAQNRTEPAAPQAANPAPAAPAAPAAPQKQLLPVDQNIKAFQNEVLKTDPAAFPKFGADGRKGREVNNAIAKYPKIASKYKLAPGTNQGANPAAAPGTAAASNTTASKDYPVNPKQPVKPRPQDPLKAQVWDSKYASGWNPDGSAKNTTVEGIEIGKLARALIESFGYSTK
jgi:hypothetical protein